MDKSKSGPLAISLIVMLLFSAVVSGLTPPPDASVLDLLKVAVTLVLGYWIGSSSSSQSKDATIAAATQAAATTATTAAVAAGVAPPIVKELQP